MLKMWRIMKKKRDNNIDCRRMNMQKNNSRFGRSVIMRKNNRRQKVQRLTHTRWNDDVNGQQTAGHRPWSYPKRKITDFCTVALAFVNRLCRLLSNPSEYSANSFHCARSVLTSCVCVCACVRVLTLFIASTASKCRDPLKITPHTSTLLLLYLCRNDLNAVHCADLYIFFAFHATIIAHKFYWSLRLDANTLHYFLLLPCSFHCNRKVKNKNDTGKNQCNQMRDFLFF